MYIYKVSELRVYVIDDWEDPLFSKFTVQKNPSPSTIFKKVFLPKEGPVKFRPLIPHRITGNMSFKLLIAVRRAYDTIGPPEDRLFDYCPSTLVHPTVHTGWSKIKLSDSRNVFHESKWDFFLSRNFFLKCFSRGLSTAPLPPAFLAFWQR